MMSYLSGGKERQYEYKLASSRVLEINGGHKNGGWTIEFTKDLQSAAFQTNQNKYPIRINAGQADEGSREKSQD
jgi:hypothetical protein